MYIIDVREHDLIRLLGSAPTKQLPIADIWIGTSEDGEIQKGGLLIERKTIRDFQASIVDGRYREQKQRLIAYAQEKDAIPVYIIEGSWFSGTSRITPQALMKLVARMQCKHKIAVLQTGNLGETSQLIEALHTYYTEDPTNFTPETEQALRAVDAIHVQKKTNASQPSHFATACLAQCPGVSVKMAQTIVEHFKSWDKMLEAEAKDIEILIQENGRKVGPVVAKRLYELLHSDWSSIS